MNLGFVLGLIVYIGWGSGDIFTTYASRHIGSRKTAVLQYIFSWLLVSLYIPFALNEIKNITTKYFIFNIVLGFLFTFGNYLLVEAFSRSSASIVGVLVQGFPAVVLLLSALIFKDPLSLRQLLWVIIIFLGAFLCTINFNDLKKGNFKIDLGIKYALIAAGMFSIFFTFSRVVVDEYGWFWSNYISYATFPLALIASKLFFKSEEAIKVQNKNKGIFAAIISAFLVRAADLSLNVGVAKGLSAIVAPLAGAAPTLFLTLSSLIYKDPVTKQQKIGLAVCLVGIILLSFFS